MKKLLLTICFSHSLLAADATHTVPAKSRSTAPAASAAVTGTSEVPRVFTEGEKILLRTKHGAQVEVVQFKFSDGLPRDKSDALVDIDDTTRKELAEYFKRVLESKTGSEKTKRRAHLYLAQYETQLELGKAHGGMQISGYCAGCHEKGSSSGELPEFINNTAYWERLLNSPDPELKKHGQLWVDKMYRQVVDRESMPRLDHDSAKLFRESAEGKHIAEFLKKHHRPVAQTAPPVKQSLPADRLARYRAMIPKVQSAELTSILNSPGTYFYDEILFPQAYIDDISGTNGFIPTSHTIAASRTEIIAGGKFRFPFGHTAGTHAAAGSKVFNFMHLPEKDGKRVPIGRYKIAGVLPRWIFPEGTVMGEVLYQKDAKQGDMPYEVRISWKQNGEWKYDAFRPFPTSEDLLRELEVVKKEPAFASNKFIPAVEAHLKNPATLSPDTLAEQSNFNGVVKVAPAARDELPPMDAVLSARLLKTPFRSSLGAVWREDPSRKLVSYAPTAKVASQIVPANYQAHHFPVDTNSCNSCHSQTQRSFWNFFTPTFNNAPNSLAEYGRMWGSDRKFSLNAAQGSSNAIPNDIQDNGVLLNAGLLIAIAGPGGEYLDTSVDFPEYDDPLHMSRGQRMKRRTKEFAEELMRKGGNMMRGR